MSTQIVSTDSGITSEKTSFVITRSFDDKPTKAPLAGSEGNLVMVGEAESGRVTSFPTRCVFEFRSQLFAKLLAAYESHDRDELERLWAKADRYEPRLDI